MTTASRTELLRTALDHALDGAADVAPAVSAVVWKAGVELYARAPDQVFDLASLTKPLCTAEVAMTAVDAGALSLDAGHALLPRGVTIAQLLQHAAGYPAWRSLWEEGSRADILRSAIATPRPSAPGSLPGSGAHLYSDLGFLALGAVLEEVGGARLDELWEGPLRWGDPAAAPTFCEERGREIVGTVHDRNAAAMGGVAPHAGLFGSAREVASTASRWMMGDVPMSYVAFARRGPGTHVLGWDTPNDDGTSSAGPRPPAGAFGHLGFTGTALWMVPARGIVAVLLTNRVHARGGPAPIRALRRSFFQAAWDGLDPAAREPTPGPAGTR
ncbi:MAG: serine hydrolase domain-containing protein [Pseudomonadota bacterium]|nr:serine hydrolase domain-containing protein [Pseudomonadota bacterium]